MSDRIAAALAGIADPAGRGGLAAAGRVAMTRFKDGKATIMLEATGLSAEQRATLERQVRAAMIGVAGVTDTQIAMTAERLERTIIAIASGKGGVGKSTVSANIAVALGRMGKKVGLVDADIYGPSQPRIMGQSGRPELVDEMIVPLPAHGVRMLSIGQLIEPGTAVAWRGPMTASALTSLMDGDWGDCEILIIDLPPGTGDVQMTLIQKWKPAGAVIVSTPQDLALIDATRAIDMFRKMDVKVIGLIENMAGYECPHCGEVSRPVRQRRRRGGGGGDGDPLPRPDPAHPLDPQRLRRRQAARRRRRRGGGAVPASWRRSCSEQVDKKQGAFRCRSPVTRTSTPCSPRPARSP